MTRVAAERAGAWLYRGIWAKLVEWFRVPEAPPTLPVRPSEHLVQFQPAPGFLKYLKLQFWIWLFLIDGAIAIAWLFVTVNIPPLGAALFIPAAIVAVVPDILAYIAIHLRYDTTWYVMTERSLRIRRGIWTIHEMTITFENVQNIKITQGPLQRFFGLKTIVVETAGGGGSEESGATRHQGILEGLRNAEEIRDTILARLRASQSAGLGDDRDEATLVSRSFARDATIRPLLNEILAEARTLRRIGRGLE
ncbi:MAG: PH domain-containing protein [Phycisphaerales bacterium]